MQVIVEGIFKVKKIFNVLDLLTCQILPHIYSSKSKIIKLNFSKITIRNSEISSNYETFLFLAITQGNATYVRSFKTSI